MGLKIMKFLKDLRVVFKQVNPRELAKIIKKTNKVVMIANKRGGMPQTLENMSSKGTLEMLTDLGNGSS
jgi:hypothetical protein